MEYKLFINGQWVDGGDQLAVTNKYTQEVFAGVPIAQQEDVEETVVAARRAAPVASVIPYEDFEEALELAAATDYGLQASIFTSDIQRVFQAIKRLNFGGVMINETPAYRADHMPYGGNRRSGLGREG